MGPIHSSLSQVLGPVLDRFELIGAEVGPELPEGHDHRQGGADHPALPGVEHAENLALLTHQIEGFAAVLGMVVHHHALADLDLIPWLHERVRCLGPNLVMGGRIASEAGDGQR